MIFNVLLLQQMCRNRAEPAQLMPFLEDILANPSHEHAKLKEIAEFAVRMLPVATTSSYAEGVFSKMNALLTPRRNRMKDDYLQTELMQSSNASLVREAIHRCLGQPPAQSDEMEDDW